MQTIALPRKVVDREDARPLRVERGEVEFEHIAFHYGKGSGVIQGLDLKVRPGERSAWSDLPAPASRPWSTCCCACTTWRADASWSMARTSPG